MDKIAKLNAFNATAIEGSFTRAADSLGISPQLVSKYIGALESELSVRLFNRSTRKVTLTEAGHRYFEQTLSIVEQLENLESSLSEYQGSISGTLRINAPVTFSTQHLAPVLHQFQRQYPNLTVDIQLNDRHVDLLEEGFDLALRIGKLNESSLVAKLLTPIKVAWCASPAYLERKGVPHDLEALQQHDVLHYSYAADKTINASQGNIPFISNNGEILVKRAILGDGIVLKPTFMVGDYLKNGQLTQILHDYVPSPAGLYVVFPNRLHMPKKVRCFIDFIADYYRQPPIWDNF